MNINEHELLNIIRSNELARKHIAIQAQIDLIDKLELDQLEEKREELESALKTVSGLMDALQDRQRVEQLILSHGANVFNWTITEDTTTHFIIEAAKECQFSDAAKQLSGYSISDAPLYPDESI